MHPAPFHDAIVQGERLFHSGHTQEALQVFEAVLASQPDHTVALNNKGVIMHGLGMYAEAEQAFLDILHQDESAASAAVNLVTLYLEQYNIPSAEAVLAQCGSFLSTEDIHELKEKLYGMQHALHTVAPTEKTKLLHISMDVNTTTHVLKLYIDERQPAHRAICECFAHNVPYRPGLSHLFASVLQDSDCVIDIGAHIGYFASLAASLVGGQGTVLCFEPEEQNYRRLNENLAVNNFAHVQSLNIALGLENTMARLCINAEDDAGHVLWHAGCHADDIPGHSHDTTRDVQVAALDSVLQGAHIPGIKLINIDTGGAEFDIVQGAVSTLLDKSVPYVVCGINRAGLQQRGASERELRQFMGYLGYETYWIRAAAPHLVLLAPEHEVEAAHDLSVLFARPGRLNVDAVTRPA